MRPGRHLRAALTETRQRRGCIAQHPLVGLDTIGATVMETESVRLRRGGPQGDRRSSRQRTEVGASGGDNLPVRSESPGKAELEASFKIERLPENIHRGQEQCINLLVGLDFAQFVDPCIRQN